jgi:hypothetical protein
VAIDGPTSVWPFSSLENGSGRSEAAIAFTADGAEIVYDSETIIALAVDL